MTRKPDRPLRLDLIIRTSKRKKEARSPQQQRDMAAACAGAHRPAHEIAAEHDSGRSESGKTMDRESVNAAMARVRAGEVDGIIFALADRIGRAPIEETMSFVRGLSKIGYLVIADIGPDPVDLSNPNAETSLVIRLQFARDQWLNAANRFQRSQRDAIKAGKYVGPTPLGYRRERGRLVEDPVTGPIIRKAFKIAASDGIHACAAFLAEQLPGRRWDVDRVRKLLRSRTYLGESRTGKLVNTQAHKPLTTLEDWTAAQTTPGARRANGDYMLSGIARCGECGSALVGQLQTVHGRTYRRYRCGTCARCSILADKLEEHVRDALKAAVANRAFRMRFVPGDVDGARDALKRAEAELKAYLTNPALSALGDAFQAGAEVRAKAVEDARAAYQTLAGQAAHSELLSEPDQLDDRVQFERALRAIGEVGIVIRVLPGRAAVADRVEFLDGDDGARMLAA